MDRIQFSQVIRARIKDYEERAKAETDLSRLLMLYDIIGTLKIIEDKLLREDYIDKHEKSQSIKGRKVVGMKAKNKREALAALDMLCELIDSPDYPDGQLVEEQVYVTNEGCACYGCYD